MSENQESPFPYQHLGTRLRKLREKQHESLLDVSGAVEIEVEELLRIEQGKAQPSEDILMLLISHFDIDDSEATGLWELAGYTKEPDTPDTQQIFEGFPKQVMVVLPMDSRVVYADSVQVNSNEHGVIMNFSQGGGPNGQMAVSRVGMSLEHAKRVYTLMGDTIKHAEKARAKRQNTAENRRKSRKNKED